GRGQPFGEQAAGAVPPEVAQNAAVQRPLAQLAVGYHEPASAAVGDRHAVSHDGDQRVGGFGGGAHQPAWTRRWSASLRAAECAWAALSRNASDGSGSSTRKIW